jgi:ubiquinone biosynthesis accessory factor UbiJ
MIEQIMNNLLGAAEIGGNHLLGMDHNALQHCSELQGHIFAINFTDVEKTLYCHPGSWGMRISLQAPAKEPSALIRGRVMALVNLSLNKDKLSTSIQERIEISGNAAVAQKFQKILTELDIDWEQQLSRLVGDAMAFRIFQGINKTRKWVNDNFHSAALSGRKYLQEENRHMPSKPEFDQFKSDVTNLRHGVERMEALLNHKLKK